MTSFLIAGDSWGKGEWGHDPYEVKHTGLQFFLEQSGHEVENISIPGCSNITSVKKITDSLNNSLKPDYILWFQTDPLRDLRPYDSFHAITTLSQLQLIANTHLGKTYRTLNELGIKIHCIGGCSKLDSSITNFSNLVPLIPSVIELCSPEFDHTLWFSDWIPYISKDFQDFDELLTIKKKNDSLGEKTEYRKFFYPDGVHANRLGHQMIFDRLCEEINLSSHKM